MKIKLISWLLCFVMITAMPFSVYAIDSVTVGIEDQAGVDVETTITVPVYISDLTDVESVQFDVVYPSDFVLVASDEGVVTPNPVFDGTGVRVSSSEISGNRIRVIINRVANGYDALGSGISQNPELISMEFEIGSNVPSGKHKFYLQGIYIGADEDSDGISTNIDYGKISVSNGIITVVNPNIPEPTGDKVEIRDPQDNDSESGNNSSNNNTGDSSNNNDSNDDSSNNNSSNDDSSNNNNSNNTGDNNGQSTGGGTVTRDDAPPPEYKDAETVEEIQMVTAKLNTVYAEINEFNTSAKDYEKIKVSQLVQGVYDDVGKVGISSEGVLINGTTSECTITLTETEYTLQCIKLAADKFKELEQSLPLKPKKAIEIGVPVASDTQDLYINISGEFIGKLSSYNTENVVLLTPIYNLEIRASELAKTSAGLWLHIKRTDEGAGYFAAIDANKAEKQLPCTVTVTIPNPYDSGIVKGVLVSGNTEQVVNKSRTDSNTIRFEINKNGILKAVKLEENFADLDSVLWAKDYIEELALLNIVQGAGDKAFMPGSNITREQFVKMIIEAFNLNDATAKCSFTDVDEGAWYYKYVAAAKNKNIINGISSDEFGTGRNITRQEMAAIAVKAAKAAGVNLYPVIAYNRFADDATIADYARENVNIISRAGIINGMGEGMFCPNNYATRAQAAKIIYLLWQRAQEQ